MGSGVVKLVRKTFVAEQTEPQSLDCENLCVNDCVSRLRATYMIECGGFQWAFWSIFFVIMSISHTNSFVQTAQQSMLLRPCFWGIIVFTTLSLLGETAVQAQAWTNFSAWKDAQNAESIATWARQMLNSRGFQVTIGTDRDELLARTLLALKDIAEDTHVVPSTRYNAILATGQLLSVEPSPGNPPVGYPAALMYLVQMYQQPDSPHYLKYGALLGIVRHTNSGIDPVQRDIVIDLLLKTVATEFEAGTVTLDSAPLEPAVWDWFRLTALDGLAALKTVGTNNKVFTELLAVINRQSQELEELTNSQNVFTREEWQQSRRFSELASKAAKTLGNLNFSEVADIDAKKMADALIRLTRAVCDIECKIAADSMEHGGTSPNPALLLERIVINIKTCVQSVVWGIRSDFLSGRPTPDSFYASLATGDPAIKRIDILLSEIIKLSTFLDEGDGTRRPVLAANLPKEFQFDIAELLGTLTKISATLAEIQREGENK